MSAEAQQTMDWHYSLFKSPPRKHYKDLDKRAKEFIDEELTKEANYENINTIQVGDWINFKVWLCKDKEPLLPEEPSELWLKIGSDEINIPFQELFVGKKIGQEFITNSLCIQEYFNSQTDNNYNYLIKIEDIVYNNFFSIENFKRHFKIKTNKAALQKIIEVFSSTNDLSLRKNIMEQLFNFLLTKHQINLPKQAVVRQQRIVVETLQINPDYGVYKLQKDFSANVYKLALRQLHEIILADYIGFQEQLEVDQNDIKSYLNLTLRPRTREFIYFKHGAINTNEQEWPIPSEMLKTMCLKEKTINHILQILS
jgi:FKBP-type peptidyl-prolyl cis-trans isomerase (trigger factor)